MIRTQAHRQVVATRHRQASPLSRTAGLRQTQGVGEGHGLVAEDAQVGEHELGPVLLQVAEEQQAQAVAQWRRHEGIEAVEVRVPAVEWLHLLVMGVQVLVQLGLLQRAARQVVAEAREQFVLEQQWQQFLLLSREENSNFFELVYEIEET